MNINEYTKYVVTNWERSRSDKNLRPVNQLESLAIMSLGLAGETGEMLEHVKKFIRDNKVPDEKFLLEAGDVFHYFIRLISEFGYSLNDVIEANVRKLDTRYGKTVPNRLTTQP